MRARAQFIYIWEFSKQHTQIDRNNHSQQAFFASRNSSQKNAVHPVEHRCNGGSGSGGDNDFDDAENECENGFGMNSRCARTFKAEKS